MEQLLFITDKEHYIITKESKLELEGMATSHAHNYGKLNYYLTG